MISHNDKHNRKNRKLFPVNACSAAADPKPIQNAEDAIRQYGSIAMQRLMLL